MKCRMKPKDELALEGAVRELGVLRVHLFKFPIYYLKEIYFRGDQLSRGLFSRILKVFSNYARSYFYEIFHISLSMKINLREIFAKVSH